MKYFLFLLLLSSYAVCLDPDKNKLGVPLHRHGRRRSRVYFSSDDTRKYMAAFGVATGSAVSQKVEVPTLPVVPEVVHDAAKEQASKDILYSS